MAYPKPLHTATINVERLVSDYLRSNKTDVEPPLTVEEVLDYVTYELAWHRKQSEYILSGNVKEIIGPNDFRKIIHGVTSDGIITSYSYISKNCRSKYHYDSVITNLEIELLSFSTPVDSLKNSLERTVQEKCASYRR